ncbi:MAG TPA: bifunctional alpha/beta hydrolase/OsmC family protein [Xanthobacteraceae bacterium]|nr:bifunctional alpha/beta hydrolase/OsmC family protein [Xanthobacteraceae bacterium]
MPAERFDFVNAQGDKLAALLDRPDGPARAVALFAHCFTCGKSNRAARHIAEGLKLHGIAVLRFDFTGLGASEGEFANTNFSSNVEDLVAAADHLRKSLMAPALLIGHSLGGAAVLAAAHRIAEAKAVVTIAAPFDPAHVVGLLGEKIADLGDKDEVEVTLAGRPFKVRRSFLDDVKEQNLGEHIKALHKALLVFHSPTDDTVGIDNASRIFTTARHPKSFISLAGADHLIGKASDAAYVARVIASWADRYLDMDVDTRTTADTPAGTVDVRETRRGKFQQEVILGDHRLLADEPVTAGGLNTGPGPYDLLLAALGACTAMTIRLYADLKQIPLARTQVRLRHEKIYATDCAECETKEGKIDRIDLTIAFEGDLTAEQRAKLLDIADKCPVHRTLTSEVDIRTTEAAAGEAMART